MELINLQGLLLLLLLLLLYLQSGPPQAFWRDGEGISLSQAAFASLGRYRAEENGERGGRF